MMEPQALARVEYAGRPDAVAQPVGLAGPKSITSLTTSRHVHVLGASGGALGQMDMPRCIQAALYRSVSGTASGPNHIDTAEWLEQLIAGEHPVGLSSAWVGQDRQGWAAQALDKVYRDLLPTCRDFVTNMSANSSVGADAKRGRLYVERLEAVPDPRTWLQGLVLQS